MKKAALSDTMPKQNVVSKWLIFSWMKRTTLIEIISLLYVILFLYTGIQKMLVLPINKALLSQSPILKPFAGMLAWGIPIAEFVVSILLFFPKFRLKGFYAALCLMIIFTLYIVIMLITSDELPCSCGGIVQQLSWPQHVIFNTIFVALAAIAISAQKKHNKLIDLKDKYLS